MNLEQFDWQTLLALLIVGMAMIVLIRHFIVSVKNTVKIGCSSCSKCTAKSPNKSELLQLGNSKSANRT